MKKTVALTLLSTFLFAETFTIAPGWSLLGTQAEIPTSKILSNSSIKNVVIYTNGAYKATNKNEFSTIPAKSGFFVYSESSTTLTLQTVDTSVVLKKVDGNGNELADDAASWKILHIKNANLYVEMKNDFTIDQKFSSQEEAIAYCTNLTIGSISGWRLPTFTELTGIGSVYNTSKDYFTKMNYNSYHWVNDNTYTYASPAGNSAGGGSSGLSYTVCIKDKN